MLPCKSKHKITKGFLVEKETGETEDVIVLGFSYCYRTGIFENTYIKIDDDINNTLNLKSDSSDHFIFDTKKLLGI